MDIIALQTLLSRMAGRRVLAVGDLMVDRFIYGHVARVSAEAPVPVLARASESLMLGAAGNVARNIAALGGAPTLIGVVGADTDGALARMLADQAVGLEAQLVEDPDRPTTTKTRFVSAGQQLLRVDHEATCLADRDVEASVARRIEAAGPGVGAVLVSDYGKGVVTDGVVRACLEAARTAGAPVIVDSKARHFDRYGPVDLIKPNAAELAFAVGMPTTSDHQVEAALARALAISPCRAVLVTRSAQGMSLAVRGQPVLHFRRPAPEVFDTAGAGDTALAALGLALAAGADLPLATEFALLAAGRAVGKAGVASVSADELLEVELAAHRVPMDTKFVTRESLLRIAASWRERGLRVGFTNGCFDILHPGHVASLTQAKGWCDKLVVALNSDPSVRRAKGPGRPVNGLEARALVLAGLACVDLVTAFDEDTPVDVIAALRPELLVKGGDYIPDAIVGADLVEGWGGEVRVTDFVEGHSTTSTLARSRNA